MRRLYLFTLIGVGIVLFVAISALLARVFSVDGAERSAITSLIQAEARGDSGAMLADLKDCATQPACRTRVAANAAALRHSGEVTILQLTPSAGFSLTSTTGTARVAWRVGSELPIVQCVRVRRAGNVLSGLHVQLLVLSRRIQSDADCPARF